MINRSRINRVTAMSLVSPFFGNVGIYKILTFVPQPNGQTFDSSDTECVS